MFSLSITCTFAICSGCSLLCASLDAAEQRLAKKVLSEFKAHFLEVVAADRIYRELCEKKVIDLTVERDITESRHVDDAQGHLFDHMSDYGTLDSLRVFCDVITSEKYNGIPAMQDLGAQMKRRLEQEG